MIRPVFFLLSYLFIVTLGEAAPIVIDDFSTPQKHTDSVNFSLSPDFNNLESEGILGGFRGLDMRYYDVNNPDFLDETKFVEVDINGEAPNRLRIVNTDPLLDPPGLNTVYLGYDGDTPTSPVFAQYGLPEVDLTDGGTNNFFEFTLHKSLAVEHVLIGVVSGNDLASEQSSFIQVPISGTDKFEQIIRVPFSDLVGSEGTDFTAVTTIFFWVTTRPTTEPVEISNFRVAGREAPHSARLSNPGLVISDAAVTKDSISVQTDGKSIAEVSLYLDLTHSDAGDLDIKLRNPNGAEVNISTGNGGSANNVFAGVLFDDKAIRTNSINYVTDFPFLSEAAPPLLAPEQALSSLTGLISDGGWVLEVVNDGGGQGLLNSWGLDLKFVNELDDVNLEDSIVIEQVATIAETTGPVEQFISIPDAGGVLCDIELTTNIEHAFPSDLNITLESPSGISAVITSGNGHSNGEAFSDVRWLSTSNSPSVANFDFLNNATQSTFSPEAPFSAFFGINPAGNWKLTIIDDAAGDVGTLNKWGIEYSLCGAQVEDAMDFCVPIESNNGNIAVICL